MDRIPLTTSSTVVALENFWSSVMNYHDRPHLVNRKLAAVVPVLFCEVSLNTASVKCLSDIFTREAVLYEMRKLKELNNVDVNFVKAIMVNYKHVDVKETTWEYFAQNFSSNFISVRILLGRKSNEKCVECVIFDKPRKIATFFAVQEQGKICVAPPFAYHIELSQIGNLRICLNNFEDAETISGEWLADKLFPKILKWTEPSSDTSIKSLTLIAPEKYCALYNKLKTKYSQDLLELWPQKAKTDPKKYIYEDLAIATYLICLWENYTDCNINFVDCGCGNGLLVYVLNEEGFKGHGLDIRARKTWEIYREKADLRVGTVDPLSTFSDASWIIGNHSDELTPWIPVIASRSSPETNYFVLPCCTYDFSGKKYVRSNTKLSQYQDYMNYIKLISEKCGFETSVDKLRIPSTKRTCLVGIRADPNQAKVEKYDLIIGGFIEMRINSGFVPRDSVEKIRNCTQLDRDLISRIVNVVVGNLLEAICIVGKNKKWNKGGKVALRDLIERIPNDDLKLLKNECGGLQTLLKNHRYIFEVVKGFVCLRQPPSISTTQKYKNKPCWFLKNHPDGCLFGAETCGYSHNY